MIRKACVIDITRSTTQHLHGDVFLHVSYLRKMVNHDAPALAAVLENLVTDHRAVHTYMTALRDIKRGKDSSLVKRVLAQNARVHFTDLTHEPIVYHVYRRRLSNDLANIRGSIDGYKQTVKRMLFSYLTSRNIIGTLNNKFGASIDRRTYGRFAYGCHRIHKQLLKLPDYVRPLVIDYFDRRLDKALGAKSFAAAWNAGFAELSNAYAAFRAAAYALRGDRVTVIAPRTTLNAVTHVLKICGVSTYECG